MTMGTPINGGDHPDPFAAKRYVYHPQLEAVAELQRVAPDVFATLPDAIRQRVGPYVVAREARIALGQPVGPTTPGGDAMNHAIRGARAPVIPTDGAPDRHDRGANAPPEPEPKRDAGAFAPADSDMALAVAEGIAQAMNFRNPTIAARAVAADLDPDGRNAGKLLRRFAEDYPNALIPDRPTGAVGQGHHGPVPTEDANARGNAWLRGARHHARDRRAEG
jgi:hypothetical protein